MKQSVRSPTHHSVQNPIQTVGSLGLVWNKLQEEEMSRGLSLRLNTFTEQFLLEVPPPVNGIPNSREVSVEEDDTGAVGRPLVHGCRESPQKRGGSPTTLV